MLDMVIYRETLLCRVGVSDSARVERGAAGGHAELRLHATALQPGHPGHAHHADHAAPAPASRHHRPPCRRKLRHHPNTTHHPPPRQRARQTPHKVHERTDILKMTYQCKNDFPNVLN